MRWWVLDTSQLRLTVRKELSNKRLVGRVLEATGLELGDEVVETSLVLLTESVELEA
jgi:hypothetical protein